jgi:hypothetical protein
MCVDCVLASLRITQIDPDDGPLPDVVLSQPHPAVAARTYSYKLDHSATVVHSELWPGSKRLVYSTREPDVYDFQCKNNSVILENPRESCTWAPNL